MGPGRARTRILYYSILRRLIREMHIGKKNVPSESCGEKRNTRSVLGAVFARFNCKRSGYISLLRLPALPDLRQDCHVLL